MIAVVAFLLALMLFLPLGIDLTVATAIEVVFLAILLLNSVRLRTFMTIEVIVFLLIVAVNVAISYAFHPEFAFQIVRSGVGPVAFLLVATLLAQHRIAPAIITPNQARIILWAIVSVAGIALINPGWLPQNVSILVEADAFSAERKFILPHTAFNVLFPLFVLNRRWLPAAACLVVILAAGSRGALVAALLSVTVFLALQRGRAILPLVGVAGFFLAVGLIYPTAYERLASQSLFDEYTRIEELMTAARAAFTPSHVLTGLPFTFPYWAGYAELGSVPDDQRVFVNTMFDVHNGFVFIVLRFGLIGAACLLIALYKLWRASPPLRPVLFSFVLLWLTSAGPISSVDGAFAIALAGLFARSMPRLGTPRIRSAQLRGVPIHRPGPI